jgi:serine/threonine protein kinase
MPILPGQTLLHYRLVEKIGEGGMGVVWRATDTTLGRDVAIKLLPAGLEAATEHLQRFEREARLLASLNHPNIATIHGLYHADGVRFLAMELVEGDDLAERIAAGPLPVKRAVEIATQIAEALEAAHAQGVIHRDLKPANIKLTSDGQVKVLDFGLAKALHPDPAPGESARRPSMSPTLTTAGTVAGVILGTAAYMSPEQARGRSVDRRADLWAFGCLLYEMLSGKTIHDGETVSDILASVLKEEADWSALPCETPPAVRRLLRRCLAKDARTRLGDAAAARLELTEAFDSPRPGESPPADEAEVGRARTAAVRLAPWIAIGLAAVALLAYIFRPSPPAVPQPSMKYSLTLPEDAPFAPTGSMPFGVGRLSLSLSPDSSRLAYVSLSQGQRHLSVRDMTTGEVERVPQTEGALNPVFSPDGKWIAMFRDQKLVRLPVDGGPVEVLGDVGLTFGLNWRDDGYLYLMPDAGTGILRLPAAGGSMEPVVKTSQAVSYPDFLPDGSVLVGVGWEDGIGMTDGGELEILLRKGAFPRYLPSGHLLFARRGQLLGVRFDAQQRKVLGEPVVLLDDIRTEPPGAQYALSENGTLIYARGTDSRLGYMTWVDRGGKTERLEMPAGIFGAFAVAPDGRRLALPIQHEEGEQIWIFDLARPGSPTRFTFERDCRLPHWTPDGTALIYTEILAGQWEDTFYKPIGGARGDEVSVFAGIEGIFSDVQLTPRNSDVLFHGQTTETSVDIWRAAAPRGDRFVIGPEDAESLLATEATEVFPAVSPDEKVIAYSTDETGRWEVYVASYPEMKDRLRVSLAGGEEARWTADGRELIYRWGSEWFAVDVSHESELSVSEPRLLFRGPYINLVGYSWDMTPDGTRFLVIEGVEQMTARTELVVRTNFIDEVRRRIP